MSDKVKISYSSANRYKTCPTKYFLSKQYKTKLKTSAFPFGKAVEDAVSELLLGNSLEDALKKFEERWETEVEGGKQVPIFDNLDVEFYASDFDKNLIFGDAEKEIEGWVKSMFGEEEKTHWLELFENIGSAYKSPKGVTEVELAFYNRVIWMCCLVRGQTMIKAFHDKMLPNVELHYVDGKPWIQKPISIENEEGDAVIGFIDFVLKHKDYPTPVIVDLKTAGKLYTNSQLETSEQLRTYVAAEGATLGTTLGGYLVICKALKVEKSCNVCGAKREGMAKNCKAKDCKGTYSAVKLDAEVQFIARSYGEDELEEVLTDYQNVTVAVKNNINFKNAANCMQYNRPCEFYEHCWGKKPIEQLKHLEPKKALTEEPSTDSVE